MNERGPPPSKSRIGSDAAQTGTAVGLDLLVLARHMLKEDEAATSRADAIRADETAEREARGYRHDSHSGQGGYGSDDVSEPVLYQAADTHLANAETLLPFSDGHGSGADLTWRADGADIPARLSVTAVIAGLDALPLTWTPKFGFAADQHGHDTLDRAAEAIDYKSDSNIANLYRYQPGDRDDATTHQHDDGVASTSRLIAGSDPDPPLSLHEGLSQPDQAGSLSPGPLVDDYSLSVQDPSHGSGSSVPAVAWHAVPSNQFASEIPEAALHPGTIGKSSAGLATAAVSNSGLTVHSAHYPTLVVALPSGPPGTPPGDTSAGPQADAASVTPVVVVMPADTDHPVVLGASLPQPDPALATPPLVPADADHPTVPVATPPQPDGAPPAAVVPTDADPVATSGGAQSLPDAASAHSGSSDASANPVAGSSQSPPDVASAHPGPDGVSADPTATSGGSPSPPDTASAHPVSGDASANPGAASGSSQSPPDVASAHPVSVDASADPVAASGGSQSTPDAASTHTGLVVAFAEPMAASGASQSPTDTTTSAHPASVDAFADPVAASGGSQSTPDAASTHAGLVVASAEPMAASGASQSPPDAASVHPKSVDASADPVAASGGSQSTPDAASVHPESAEASAGMTDYHTQASLLTVADQSHQSPIHALSIGSTDGVHAAHPVPAATPTGDVRATSGSVDLTASIHSIGPAPTAVDSHANDSSAIARSNIWLTSPDGADDVVYDMPADTHYGLPGPGVPPHIAQLLMGLLATNDVGNLTSHLDHQLLVAGDGAHAGTDSVVHDNHGVDHHNGPDITSTETAPAAHPSWTALPHTDIHIPSVFDVDPFQHHY